MDGSFKPTGWYSECGAQASLCFVRCSRDSDVQLEFTARIEATDMTRLLSKCDV